MIVWIVDLLKTDPDISKEHATSEFRVKVAMCHTKGSFNVSFPLACIELHFLACYQTTFPVPAHMIEPVPHPNNLNTALSVLTNYSMNSWHFMKPEGSSPYSQKLETVSIPSQTNPVHTITSHFLLKAILILSLYRQLGLPSFLLPAPQYTHFNPKDACSSETSMSA
jgi:hypothetical protein